MEEEEGGGKTEKGDDVCSISESFSFFSSFSSFSLSIYSLMMMAYMLIEVDIEDEVDVLLKDVLNVRIAIGIAHRSLFLFLEKRG